MTARRRQRLLVVRAAPWVLAAGLLVVEKVAFDHRSATGESTLAAPLPVAETAPDPTPRPPTLADDADIIELRRRRLLIPVEGVSAVMLVSTFHHARHQGEHEALDILAPLGTPALAVEDGTVEKLFASKRGGLTIYLFDPTGVYCYYYAHLDHYADMREGQHVRRRQVIGYVGTTGNAPANTPHLHFAVFKLGPEKRWWQGTPLDPFLIWR
jgi:peptidoglycan LD-endopeptidase LytH